MWNEETEGGRGGVRGIQSLIFKVPETTGTTVGSRLERQTDESDASDGLVSYGWKGMMQGREGAGEGRLEAAWALGRERQWVAELGQHDVEHQQGDEHADRRVQDLLQVRHLLLLLPGLLLHIRTGHESKVNRQKRRIAVPSRGGSGL